MIGLGHKRHNDVPGWATDDFEESKPVITIELPATMYELQDVLDRVGLKEDAELHIRYDAGEYEYLEPRLENLGDVVLLNAAAEKLIDMDEEQLIAVIALVQKDTNSWQKQISASRLYDLVCAADQCEVIPDITDAYELGRYLAGKNLIPELAHESEAIKRIADYRLLGNQIQSKNDGIFIGCQRCNFNIPYKGYVRLKGEIKEYATKLNRAIELPSYSMRIYARCHETKAGMFLNLPMEPEELNKAIATLNAPRPEELEYLCDDCKIPMLNDVIRYYSYSSRNTGCADFEQLNELAQRIADLTYAETELYRAALTLRKPVDASDALYVLQEIEDYDLRADVRSVRDYGESEIKRILDECDAQYVLANLNLESYGKDLIEFRDIYITEYGAIERKDGLSICPINEERQQEAPVMSEPQM